jgi:photosystem II stability/assembly factor-like uncharacterized protein
MKPNMLQQPKKRFLLRAMLLLLMLLPTILVGAEQWTILPFPIHETITGLSFPTPDIGYAVTSGGKYARSIDSGKTWKGYVLSKDEPAYEDVFFLNKDTGVICGRRGFVARTIDGCKNWTRAFWGDTMISFTSVVILGPDAAVLIGLIPGDLLKGVAYRSRDAGLNWVQLPDSGFGFGELFYHTGDPLCFQSYGKLHYSLDSGKTWSTLKTSMGKAGRATAFYGQTGVICGGMAMLSTSTDRGRTWTSVTMDKPDVHFTSVALVDEMNGYIAGTAGTVMKTVDGGKVWSPESVLKEPIDFACMQVVGNYLFIGGADGALVRKKVK